MAEVLGVANRACGILVNAAPVVSRELRAESRRSVNYWLRVMAAGMIIVVFASLMSTTQLDASKIGLALFSALHSTLLLGFWIVAPLMTADCVSGEKREGTLGLLFLTPLTVLDVIVGKSAIHILRACTLFLAATPVLVLPLVLGGVSWIQVVTALKQEGIALLLGIAAGLYASTKGGTTIQVMVRAEWYALVLATISTVGNLIIRSIAAFPLDFAGYFALSLFFELTLFGFVLAGTAGSLEKTWNEESVDSEQPRWIKIFSDSEFWRDLFRWDTSRTLDRNPMAWLQEYSWTARLTKWGWFILFLFADLVVMTDLESRRFLKWLPILTGGLALGVAFSAAGSFRRERQTGLLEVLLVTPISARKVIAGRMWGMFSNYLPALLALLLYWQAIWLLNTHVRGSELFRLLFPNPLAFGALMIVGLYVSLTRLNFFLGWLLTWLLAFVIPSFLTIALGRYARIEPSMATVLPSCLQIVLATVLWFLLERDMRSRAFVRATS
jgi:ABC-type transport system involved in multi-copper enzyme maturation permease subunit